MSDLILEFYSEEIPSRMQKKASIDLKDIFINGLDLAGLDYSKINTYSSFICFIYFIIMIAFI